MSGVFPDSGVVASQASNTIPDIRENIAPGCTALWYSTSRCQPRFDPAAANAMLSEFLNAVNCDGNIQYDCTRFDNLCMEMKSLWTTMIHGCIGGGPFPAADGCTVSYMALSTDAAGCTRITRYDPSALQIADITECSVQPAGPGTVIPDTTTYYTATTLYNDAVSGAVNETILANSIVLQGDYTVTCQGALDIFTQVIVNFNPGQNPGIGAVSEIVARIDNQWLLGIGALVPLTRFTNFQIITEGHVSIYPTSTFTAPFTTVGTHHIQLYVVSGSANPPAQIARACAPTGAANGAIIVSKLAT